ncbi:MAG: succinate dehydrogenase / fumarate reductase cytochrome b subunit [Planctomycetota bacterium]|jgi:succinate dehydrogenase / fumarate reductase cytochrome b subunit
MSKTSSIVRKLLMALTGFFLMVFLLQHLLINMLSVISPEMFNSVSLFMGTNPVVQFAMQPILMFSVVFHFIWGMKLELENRSSRPIKYAVNNGAANSTWMSRNMIITGVMVLMFLALHFYDFWIPEVKTKFIDGNWTGMHDGGIRFYEELVHKFQDPIRVGLYVLAFISLALHLLHGFQSAFQTVGFNHTKYTPIIKLLGNVYAILIPLGFAFVAIFHFLAH